jgi:hypothetical protein
MSQCASTHHFTVDAILSDFPLAEARGFKNLNQAGTGQAKPKSTAVSGAASSNKAEDGKGSSTSSGLN